MISGGDQSGGASPVVTTTAPGVTTGPMPSQKIRIPQAQRAAATQSKVIEAAIACLHRSGYAAAGVAQVAQEAGVSRGAMSHQFPTKADLMIAVVRNVFEQDAAHYLDAAGRMDAAGWLRSLPQLMWEVLTKPSAIAVMEIMLAARSDEDLAGKLRPMQETIDADSKRWLVHQFALAGVAMRPDFDATHHLFVASVRGLAMESVFMKNHEAAEQAMAAMSAQFANLYPQLYEDKT
jgi:AcrR family transcriptional regulator